MLTFQITLTERKTSPQRVNFIEQVVEGLIALPGVQAAAATDSLPLTDFSRITPAEIEGRPPIDFRKAKPGEIRPASRPTVTLDYFNAMGIPVKNGRAFTSQDARPTAGVVIVNEAFEKHHFPGESAIGKRIRLRAGPAERRWQTIVGVVSDVRQSGLAGEVMAEVYSPELADVGEALSFVIRTTGEPDGLISSVRRVVAEVDSNQPLHNVMTMEQRLANTTTSRRLNTALLGSFAAVALLLALVGIYGVMSYAVTQRRRETPSTRNQAGARKAVLHALARQEQRTKREARDRCGHCVSRVACGRGNPWMPAWAIVPHLISHFVESGGLRATKALKTAALGQALLRQRAGSSARRRNSEIVSCAGSVNYVAMLIG